MFINKKRPLCYSIGIIFFLFLVVSLIFGKSSTANNLPFGSHKLLDAEAIRGFFLEGQTAAKVIVNLAQPAAAQELRNLEDEGVQNPGPGDSFP